MPHDINGKKLKVGDRVTMEFTVLDVMTNEDYCNCTLASVQPFYPGNGSTNLSAVNTKQLVKVG